MSEKSNSKNGRDESPKLNYFYSVVKAKNDPIWFFENIIGMKLWDKQKEIMMEFYRNSYDNSRPIAKTLVICAGMRSSKSVMAAMIATYEFFKLIILDSPSEHYGLLNNQEIFITVAAVSDRIAKDGVYAMIRNFIESNEFFKEHFPQINFTAERLDYAPKHAHVQVVGSWATTAVGRSNICIVMDESSLFEQSSSKRGAFDFYARLRKSTETFGDNGKVVVISSPSYPDDLTMTLLKDNRNVPNAVTYQLPTWEINPNFSEETLRLEYAHDMGTFYRDFMANPTIAGGVQFPEGIFLVKMPNVLRNENILSTDVIRVIGMDPAIKNDGYGLAVGYKNREGQIIIDGALSLRKQGDEPFLMPSYIWEKISHYIRYLNINYMIFDTWMAPEVIEKAMKEFGIEPIKHIVKKDTYDLWRGLQEQPNKLQVVYDEELERECLGLRVKETSSLSPKVDHPFNGSKDISDAVANCIWFLATETELENTTPQILLAHSL